MPGRIHSVTCIKSFTHKNVKGGIMIILGRKLRHSEFE